MRFGCSSHWICIQAPDTETWRISFCSIHRVRPDPVLLEQWHRRRGDCHTRGGVKRGHFSFLCEKKENHFFSVIVFSFEDFVSGNSFLRVESA